METNLGSARFPGQWTLVVLRAWVASSVVFLPALGVAQSSDVRQLLVDQLRQAPPPTPQDLLTNADLLIQVGAYEEAGRYLQLWLDRDLPPQALLEVRKELGTPLLLRFLRTPAVASLGNRVSARITKAEAALADQRLQSALEQVVAPDANARAEARSQLAVWGARAAGPLLQKAAEESDLERQRHWQAGLDAVGRAAIPVYLAAIPSEDTALQLAALRGLRRWGNWETLPFVLWPCHSANVDPRVRAVAVEIVRSAYGRLPHPEMAGRLVQREVDRLLTDPLAISTDELDQAVVWTYHKSSQSFKSRVWPREDAALFLATWLTDDARRMAANDVNHVRFIACRTGWAYRQLDAAPAMDPEVRQRLHQEMAVTPAILESALAFAREHRLVPSAVGVLDWLSHEGGVSQLNARGSQPCPVAAALRDPHPRIRWAAAHTIAAWDPVSPFHGASDLVDVLVQASGGRGARAALLIHPSTAHRDRLAGWLRARGFRVWDTNSPREGQKIARAQSDIELLLVADTFPQPTNVVAQMAQGSFTGSIPMIVLTSGGQLEAALVRTSHDPQVVPYPLPRDAATVDALLAAGLPATDRFAPSPRARLAEAAWALSTIRRWTQSPRRYSFYEWQPHTATLAGALQQESLAASAAAVLGGLAGPDAQTALVEYAGRPLAPAEIRRKAVAAINDAIQRSGVLLSHRQILTLYERYNALREADEASAEILGLLLDAVERPTRSAPGTA